MTAPSMLECERLNAAADRSQEIGRFLDWMEEQGWQLAKEHNHKASGCPTKHGYPVCEYSNGSLEPYIGSKEKLLADFYSIDLDKVEAERAAMLKYLRTHQDEKL